jgi:hypothetical protein
MSAASPAMIFVAWPTMGPPSTNLYGADMVNYWNVGCKMFRDKGHFDAHFIEADTLSESDPALSPLKGKVDIVSVTHVFHSWGWDGQIKAAKALATFTKPGWMIVGSQVGKRDKDKMRDLGMDTIL